MDAQIRARIAEIPGETGWWKGEDGPLLIAREMLEHGVDEDTVVRWIQELYYAVADEFGS